MITIQDYLDDIKGLLQNAEGDIKDNADLVDFTNEIIAEAVKIRDKAQGKINAKVDSMTNAFDMGGSLHDLEEILTAIRRGV